MKRTPKWAIRGSRARAWLIRDRVGKMRRAIVTCGLDNALALADDRHEVVPVIDVGYTIPANSKIRIP